MNSFENNGSEINRTPHNLSVNSEEILSELSKAKVLELLPILVLVAFLMVSGLAGNTSVLFFFRRKARKDTTSFFIMTLAVVDSIVCLDISLTIVELTTIYSFKNDAACKFYVVTKICTSLFSSFILLTIAAYRYRKICCPFKRQLTLKWAKIAVGCDLLLAVLLSSPQILLFGSVSEKMPNDYNVTVTGFDCGMKLFDNKLVVLNAFMSYTYACIFTVAFAALIIMYGLQGKAISKFNKDHLALKFDGREKPSRSQSHESGIDSLAKSSLIRLDKVGNTTLNNEVSPLALKTETDDEEIAVRRNRKVTKAREKHISVVIPQAKITIMFLIITLCFMLSFLPYLLYSLWRSFNIKRTDAFTRDTIKVQLCLNSYLINSVINPIVYGFFHIDFRQYIKRFLCKWCCSKTIQLQNS